MVTKVAFWGSARSNKTQYVHKLMGLDSGDVYKPTVGAEIYKYKNYQLWDCSHECSNKYFRDTEILVILGTDCDEKESFVRNIVPNVKVITNPSLDRLSTILVKKKK